jgi:predicted nucleic acid-binding protein
LIYLDSCLVIYALELPNGAGQAIRQKFGESANQEFAISPLVIMECLAGPIKSGDTYRRAQYQSYLETFVMVPLSVEAALKAAELRASFRIKTPDAFHLAAALVSGCDALWTNDHRLSTAAGSFAQAILEEASHQ